MITQSTSTSAVVHYQREKAWSQMYLDKISILHQATEKERLKTVNALTSTIKGAMLAKRFCSKVRRRLNARLATSQMIISSKRSIENMKEPDPPLEFSDHWNFSSVCDVCGQYAVTDIKCCKFCNCVAHRLCILPQAVRLPSSLEVEDYDSDSGEVIFHDKYVCALCNENRQIDTEYFNKVRTKLREDKILKFFRDVISKKVLAHMERKKFLKFKKGCVLIQSFIRRLIARREFYLWRRCQMRIVVIELKSLPSWLESLDRYLVTLTVVDPVRHSQIYRIDKRADKVASEVFLLPGITAFMTVVVSICEKRDDGQYGILCQCQLSLRDSEDFISKKKYSLTQVQNIMWHPQDIRRKEDSTVHIFPQSPGYTIPLPSPPPCDPPSEPPTEDHVGATRLDNDINVPPPRAYDNSLLMLYAPQNPISALCAQVSAPPLDILKKGPEIAKTQKAKHTQMEKSLHGRMRPWWICLLDLNLYFFETYGDPKPRIVANVSRATATSLRDKGEDLKVTLVFDDERIWAIDFQSCTDALRFEFCMAESLRCLESEAGSIYMRFENIEAGRARSYGYESIALIH